MMTRQELFQLTADTTTNTNLLTNSFTAFIKQEEEKNATPHWAKELFIIFFLQRVVGIFRITWDLHELLNFLKGIICMHGFKLGVQQNQFVISNIEYWVLSLKLFYYFKALWAVKKKGIIFPQGT